MTVCGGVTLDGYQVPTKATLRLPCSGEKGQKIEQKACGLE